ncbi:MAG: hypothetical protein ACLPWS_07720 [Rhodomicrobium sp.]
MSAWLSQHQAKLQFGPRMTLAALVSYALGEALGLAQTYWATPVGEAFNRISQECP